MTEHPQNPMAATIWRDYRVTPERRADAGRARTTIMLVAAGVLVLSLLPWLFVIAGSGINIRLAYSALVLTALALLLILRVLLIVRKADRFVASDGSMLRLAQEGITVAGDTFIPWQAVSGVWALDSAPALRARAANSVTGLPGRLMLRAGTNTANVTIGIVEASWVVDPAQRLKRFTTLSNGCTPARLEFPFGSRFGTEELHDAFGVLRWALPAEVPVRLATGAMDYASAWAGTADDVATIREREAKATA